MTQASELLASRYRLDAQIAAGGIGEVWRAHDLVLDRPVAVKMLRSEYAGQPQALARFRAEARQAGSVSHQSIAQVYDYGEGGPAGSPYLVMELVDGPALADVLATGPLDAASALDVLAQAAAGLQAAHAVGVVHRDIKPANLVIGPGGQVKITDFGIAYAAGSAQLTETGMVLGTPAYLAPEQLAGDGASPASDLYALGVVGYECLTGTRPFRGEPIEVAAAHRDLPLPPLGAAVPTAAAALVAELTAKDPAARPHDAASVATRASLLRDWITGGAETALAGLAGGPVPCPEVAAHPHTLVEAQPLTWHDAHPGPTYPPATRVRQRPGRGRRRALVTAAGVALLAGLGAWLLAATMPALPSSHGSPSAQVSHPASSPTVQTVEVNSAALVGQPVSAVSQQLSQLGLTPAITWTASDQDPGTVLSVQPSGPVPTGSTVTVVAAFPVTGHGHHHFGHGDNGD